MAWTYNDQNIATLYRKWAKFGWLVSEPTYEGEVDLEELIAETTWAARYDGRLMKWLLTWFKDFGDLVNKKRLLRFLKKADTAVLGVAIEIAMNRGADKNFKTILEKCKPLKRAEVFQKGMEDVTIYIEDQKKYGKPEFKKWGFFCTMIEFYTDAQRGREWVLENNKLFALRSIFGVNIRSEIIYTLYIFNGIAIRRLSKLIGYAYSGVYREIENMVANGLINEEYDHGRILRLSDKMQNLIKLAA